MAHIEEIRAQSNNITAKQIANYFSKFYMGDNRFYDKGTKLIRFVQDMFTAWIEDENIRSKFCTRTSNNVFFLNGTFALGGGEHADHFQMVFETLFGSIVTITEPHFKNDRDFLITIQVAKPQLFQTAQAAVNKLDAQPQCSACIMYPQLMAHGPEAFKIVLKTHNIDDLINLVYSLRLR